MDRGIASAPVVIDHDAVGGLKARRFRQRIVRYCSGPDHNEIGCGALSSRRFDRDADVRQVALGTHAGTQAHVHAAGAVAFLDEGGGFFIANSRKEPRCNLDHRVAYTALDR